MRKEAIRKLLSEKEHIRQEFKEEVIQHLVPHYKTDALVRIQNTLRYDDREVIRVNLLEAYDQVMAFVAKHLPDKFYMEGAQRVSLRTKIFREVVANLFAHREYTNATPCTIVIYADRLETHNANNPHGEGPIDPDNFKPFPKNPIIGKFFTQIGHVEELGSGVVNTNRLVEKYANHGKPIFLEECIFKAVIPLPKINDTVSDTVNDTVKQRLMKIIMIIIEEPGIRKSELMRKLDVSSITIKRDMQRIRQWVEFIGMQKTGGYFPTEQMKLKLKGNKQTRKK